MSDRVVEGTSLENWHVERHRGFESHLIRILYYHILRDITQSG